MNRNAIALVLSLGAVVGCTAQTSNLGSSKTPDASSLGDGGIGNTTAKPIPDGAVGSNTAPLHLDQPAASSSTTDSGVLVAGNGPAGGSLLINVNNLAQPVKVISKTGEFCIMVPLQQGTSDSPATNTITVQSQDASGNLSDKQTATVMQTGLPPQPTPVKPGDPTNVAKGAQVAHSGIRIGLSWFSYVGAYSNLTDGDPDNYVQLVSMIPPLGSTSDFAIVAWENPPTLDIPLTTTEAVSSVILTPYTGSKVGPVALYAATVDKPSTLPKDNNSEWQRLCDGNDLSKCKQDDTSNYDVDALNGTLKFPQITTKHIGVYFRSCGDHGWAACALDGAEWQISEIQVLSYVPAPASQKPTQNFPSCGPAGQ